MRRIDSHRNRNRGIHGFSYLAAVCTVCLTFPSFLSQPQLFPLPDYAIHPLRRQEMSYRRMNFEILLFLLAEECSRSVCPSPPPRHQSKGLHFHAVFGLNWLKNRLAHSCLGNSGSVTDFCRQIGF